MRPRFSLYDQKYRPMGYSISLRDGSECRAASGICGANISNAIIGKFCLGISRSTSACTPNYFSRMIHIVSLGAPFQIGDLIVRLYEVLMIYLGEIVWVWNKRCGHYPMDCTSLSDSIAAQPQLGVILPIDTWKHKASRFPLAILPKASNPPERGNFVNAFISRYRQPFFAMHMKMIVPHALC